MLYMLIRISLDCGGRRGQRGGRTLTNHSPTSHNYVYFICNMLLCCSALSLWYIVKRTKQCLDFTLTVHLIHFIVCCIYNARAPTSISWWLTNTVVIVIMTVLGEFLCMRTEMAEIPLGGSARVDL